jgi:hypothetical protein
MSSSASPTPLLVEIAPHSSSFFAGEAFVCTLTFINTLPAPPPSSPLTTPTPTSGYFPRHGHAKSHSVDVRTFARDLALEKRDEGAQDARYYAERRERDEKLLSQSAVPRRSFALHRASESLHRLPSSASLQEEEQAVPRRRGMVGRRAFSGAAAGTAASTTAQTKGHRVSQSLSASHARSGLGIGHPVNDASGAASGSGGAFRTPLPSGGVSSHNTALELRHASASSATSASALASSSVPRSASSSRLPSARVPAAHPHARKESVAAIQAEDLSSAFALDSEPSSSSTSSGSSTPRLAHPATSRATFYGAGEAANDTLESVLRDDITNWSAPRASSSSTSNTPVQSPLFPPSSSRRAAPAEGSVRLLWAYAQFGGEFRLDESLIKPAEFEDMKRRLLSTSSFGGGSLFAPAGLTAAAVPAAAPEEVKRRASWGSYLSPSAWRGHARKGSTLEETRRKLGESRAVPLFVTQPSVLLVDVDLKPGERRSCESLQSGAQGGVVEGKDGSWEKEEAGLTFASSCARETDTFRLPLPPDLPPSYSGRSISFNYTLTLGTNRLDTSSSSGGSSGRQRSRLIRIPLRIYNHVAPTGTTLFFDLQNPVVWKSSAHVDEEADEKPPAPQSQAQQQQKTVREGSKSGEKRKAGGGTGKNEQMDRKAFDAYATSLVASCTPATTETREEDVATDLERVSLLVAQQQQQQPGSTAAHSSGAETLAVPTQLEPRPNSPLGRRASVGAVKEDVEEEEEGGPTSTMQAVELLSRNSSKGALTPLPLVPLQRARAAHILDGAVSYDIAKDGQLAAVLTLVKSKYRLGDTVLGVVSTNFPGAVARVVRVAAALETHESIEPTLATLPAARGARMTKVVHAEAHECALDVGQVGFQLPIPSGATPDFVTSAGERRAPLPRVLCIADAHPLALCAVKLHWTVRLSFLTLSTVKASATALRVAPPPHLEAVGEDGYEHYHLSLCAVDALSGPASAARHAQLQRQEGEEWPQGTKLELVECAVPLAVLPHSTRFQPGAASVYA